MAFRRTRRFKRRGGGRPVARVNRWWSPGLFDNLDVPATGADSAAMVLADGTDATAHGSGLNDPFVIKRVIFNGGIVFTPLTSAFQRVQYHLSAALYIIDADDTDTSLTTTLIASILNGGSDRVLWTYSWAGLVVEGVSANALPEVYHGVPVNIDWKGTAGIRRESELHLAFQLQTDATSALSSVVVSGQSRVLCQER